MPTYDPGAVCCERLADRILEVIGDQPMLSGHMAFAASGQGGLLVRIDPAGGEKLLPAGAPAIECHTG